ncbi:MAG: cysteine desulfurase-like protein [Alicyclobacillaceae bacterium]|nr:cysteine desulfurase-like protein [Alicyclobacillaceae bacterium]
MWNVEATRKQFPALTREYGGRQAAYFDGPGGSQVVQSCIDAMSAYMIRGGANLHGVFPSSVETEEVILHAREHAAAFLGAEPNEIAFGANMTTLNFAISRALSRDWTDADNIVVTELDHRANVDPWISAAKDKGASIRFLQVDPETLTLRLDEMEQVITEGTKLVAIGLASNAVGTVNDVRRVADVAHRFGATVAVDAVHAAPHISVQRDELGADILLCSAYKFFGPHLGIAAIRSALFERLETYRLLPAPDGCPDKLETGTQNHEGLAGLSGAIDFIARLGHGETLREQLQTAMAAIEAEEEALAQRLRDGLESMAGVHLYTAPAFVRKTPTVAFNVDGMSPRNVCKAVLETAGVFVADGDFYATTLVRKLGVLETGGLVRAGLAPYSTVAEVDRLLQAVERLG